MQAIFAPLMLLEFKGKSILLPGVVTPTFKKPPWKPRESKITNMSNHVTVQENIAWLKITVNDWHWLILVKIIKGGCHINCNA
ncbi:hypothetical protein EJB05_24823 [Eragrostis curvula]|uniref:Uncharacterized protein n=1 Tax=Eragrostis curvula TaxID=38414 RepID=A0A5J9V9W6_9POAL|nr:hypothetical protein EJB05_24823 [Eragrostis curvula]